MKNIEEKVENAPEYLSKIKEEVIEELGAYSITPPTLRRHAFGPVNVNNKKEEQDKGIDNQGKFSQGLHDLNSELKAYREEFETFSQNLITYRENLRNSPRNVVSDGDLTGYFKLLDLEHSKLLDKITPKLNDFQEYQTQFQKFLNFINENPELCLNFEQEYKNNGQVAKRYGINVVGLSEKQLDKLLAIYKPITEVSKDTSTQSSKSGGSVSSKPSSGKEAKKDQAKPILLTPLEIMTLKDAVEYLNTTTESNNNKNPGIKAVCVDIFARAADGSIRVEEKKGKTIIETHVVVIYKNSNQEYFIIDPSNSNYSKHLEYNSEIIFGNSQAKFIAPQKEVIIYKGVKENTGPGKDQYRDCIDIAVKLTFGFNKAQSTLDIKNLGSNGVVQEITNDRDIDPFMPKTVNSFKIKQASNDTVRACLKEISHSMKNNLEKLARSPSSDSEQIHFRNFGRDFQDLIDSQSEYNKYKGKLGAMLDLSKDIEQHLSNDFQNKISGQLDLYKEE